MRAPPPFAFVFFAAFALCALLTKTHVVSWNDGSRIATVDALTADRTFEIDGSPYAIDLGDKIRYRGRLYSDKPPLLSVMAAGVGILIAPLGIGLRRNPAPAIYLMTLFTVGLFFARGCAYAYLVQRLLGFSRRASAAVAALSGAATLALPYAVVLANHVPCGTSAIGGYFYLLRSERRNVRDVAFAGMSFGLAYAFDAIGVIAALGGAVLLWGAPLRLWFVCAAAMAPFIALQLIFNAYTSGSVIPPAMNQSVWTSTSLELYAKSAHVFSGFSPLVYVRYAGYLLAGGKGLFVYTPLMFVAAFGLYRMLRVPGTQRRLAIAIAVTFAVDFVLIVLFQNDYLARNFGERRYVDVFFLLCIPLGTVLASVREPAGMLGIRIAIALSIAIAALGTVAPFGGAEGESGFRFAAAAFAEIARRTPVMAALDVLLLAALIAAVLRLVELPAADDTERRLQGF